ncbi:lysine/ornithine decarboxylase [Pseudoalteromonas sp. MMG013]|uniref:lysine/ornithine decarboxylase n=1 Tax=Pseudoalteromonas sp. MMG013 TaxID=2822687 RepID=UPI001B370FCE|nr:lysine/ornithine decarboxylase [Pseudoalteromonas sp. MMG013]MBQ4863756.1 lysine/ornithine decarboxylase [Pseudoalteromonas sp. MMG013]
MSKEHFTAITHPLVEQLLDTHKEKMFEWAYGLGAPLHVLFPQIFAENVARITSVLTTHQLKHQILYAKKANKSQCFITQSCALGLGVDVASIEEFELALAGGVCGEKIGVSGPHKSRELLTLAIRHNALVAIDSINELKSAIEIVRRTQHATQNMPIRILLRVHPSKDTNSRFGLVHAEIEEALSYCVEYKNHTLLQGFSCHLSGYNTQQRGQAIHYMCDCIKRANHLNLNADVINIGGGLPVSYLDSTQWQDALDYEYFHKNRQFSGFYPYHCAQPGADALAQILLTPNQAGQTAADAINSLSLTLMLEPGRALLDQAGVSLFSVQGSKPLHGTSDCHIATLSGTSLSLSEQWFNSEFLPSPRLLSKATPSSPSPVRVAFGSATCLEDDMISWRYIPLPHLPTGHDLMVYINTAGYQMDSNESEFHSMPIPRKITVRWDSPNIHWQLER